METTREIALRRKIKLLTWLFIIGLVLSGATAIPLRSELDLLANLPIAHGNSSLAVWLSNVQAALVQTDSQFPFLFYGTDWLAFGHFVIAIAFIGALRDPVRNSWLYTFGMIACALIIPYALFFGLVRGIPFWWRLIDCLFGIFGFIPVWLCNKWVQELEASTAQIITPSMHRSD